MLIEGSKIKQSDGEVIAFFIQMWKRRFVILFCMIITTLISILYSVSSQEWWSATSIVSPPKIEQLMPVNKALKGYKLNLAEKDKDPLGRLLSEYNVLKMFLIEFNTYENKKEFFDEKYGANSFNSSWDKKIYSKLFSKDISKQFELHFQSTTKKEANDSLLDYINFTNKKISQYLIDDIKIELDKEKLMLQSKLDMLSIKAKMKINDELIKSKYSLLISQSANSKSPIYQMNQNEVFSIELGSDALKEKIKILSSFTQLSIFEPEISEIESNLIVINKIDLDDLIGKITFYSYIKKPGYSTSLDKPRRKFIVFLGLLFGVVFGCISVIFLDKIKVSV